MLQLGARARLEFQCAVVAIAEGAQLSTSLHAAPHVCCVAAVLSDARMCALGGREGLARSLGSVYAGAVSRFLRGSFSGRCCHRVRRPLRFSDDAVMFDVSQDGSRLFVGLYLYPGGSLNCEQLCVLRTADGAIVDTVACCHPNAVAVAPDDTVYVVQCYGPTLVFDPSLAERRTIKGPGAHSISASVDHVAFCCDVSVDEHEIVVMRRCDHEIAHRISCAERISACCFTAKGAQVAVAHVCSVAIHTVVDGGCVRRWNISTLRMPLDIKSIDFDEFAVLRPHDHGTDLIVYDSAGRILRVMQGTDDSFHGIAVRGGALFTNCLRGVDLSIEVYV